VKGDGVERQKLQAREIGAENPRYLNAEGELIRGLILSAPNQGPN
jgi:hypothetical protein